MRPGGPAGAGEDGMIPVCDLRAQFLAHETELRGALERVLQRGWFILGEELAAFEEEYARFLGGGFAVGVASGTDAIHLALRAIGLRPGDEVLTAPNSAVPTAAGIVQAGGVPVFADVDPETGLLDPEDVERRLTPRVRAILPVHLYGRCAPLGPILELAARRGIPVIEDAAQAHGAVLGGRAAGLIGTIGCFSFYPSKNLGAYGDGGACTTADPVLAERLRRLRNYGERARYDSVELGFNSRLDELQAAILRVKLPHLEEWNARRRELAAAYRRRLAGLALGLPPEAGTEGAAGGTDGRAAGGAAGGVSGGAADGTAGGAREDVAHLFVVRVARRDRLRKELEARGVGTQVHYPVPIHRQPAYAYLDLPPGSFPVAERRAGQIVSLPLYPEMTAAMVDTVAGAVADALRGEEAPAPAGGGRR